MDKPFQFRGPSQGAPGGLGDEWDFSGAAIWGRTPLNARVKLAQLVAHSPSNGMDAAAIGRLMGAAQDLAQALEDVLPYAIAAIGVPREGWPHDSVVLTAERALAKARGR